MIRVAIVAVGLVFATAPVFAREACDRNDQTQSGMNICAAADASAADATLNRLYKQLIAKTEGKEKDALRVAQRAWIAYRDKECAYETIAEEGGSIRPMEISLCETEKTKARIKDFEQFLRCAPGDLSCAK